MVKKFRRLSSGILAMVMIFSLCFTNAVQAASIDISSENETVGLRTQLTFLEGMPGDNHLVYMILSILVYTLFSRMFDLMQRPVVNHSIVGA